MEYQEVQRYGVSMVQVNYPASETGTNERYRIAEMYTVDCSSPVETNGRQDIVALISD